MIINEHTVGVSLKLQPAILVFELMLVFPEVISSCCCLLMLKTCPCIPTTARFLFPFGLGGALPSIQQMCPNHRAWYSVCARGRQCFCPCTSGTTCFFRTHRKNLSLKYAQYFLSASDNFHDSAPYIKAGIMSVS